jgi:hypothetical protein
MLIVDQGNKPKDNITILLTKQTMIILEHKLA